MTNGIIEFNENKPSKESYWRSVILFGRNSASYKFSLAESLLEVMKERKTEVRLEDLAVPYSKNICEHLKKSPRQTTSKSSKFIESCDSFNNDGIGIDELIDETIKNGFNHVFDAFHNVNGGELPIKFFEKDFQRGNKKLTLTDDFYSLEELECFENFHNEVESRWNLVETAWEVGVNSSLLNIEYDDEIKKLFVEDEFRRKDVTSARGALNGYQKGKCFYCFDDISVESRSDKLAEVDHFFPHTLVSQMDSGNINGVWNLVLACEKCNRGADGKFAKVPHIKFLERLSKRNEFLISSHHPLRETIMNQIGMTYAERRLALLTMDKFAINILLHRWEPVEQVGEEVF